MVELVVGKGVFGALIFLTTVAACFLPFLVGNIIKGNLGIFCACTGFSGGVLLGAGLIHMLPESEEQLGGDYPWAHLIAVSGYVFTYFIESFAFRGGVSHKHDHVVAATTAAERSGKATLCVGDMDAAIVVTGGGALYEHKKSESFGTFKKSLSENPPLLSNKHTLSEHSKSGVNCIPDSHEHDTFSHKHSHGVKSSDSCANEHVHDVHVHHIEFNDESALTAIILCLALSFHSVIAGTSVGLAMDWTEFWAVVIAITSHKFVVSFTLGLRFLQQTREGTGIPISTVIIQLVFALMVPLGVTIGIIIHGQVEDTESTFPAMLQSLSAGCFLYVGIITVTESTDSLPRFYKFTKFWFIAVGIAFMCYVKTLE